MPLFLRKVTSSLSAWGFGKVLFAKKRRNHTQQVISLHVVSFKTPFSMTPVGRNKSSTLREGWRIHFINDTEMQGNPLLLGVCAFLCGHVCVCRHTCVCTRGLMYTQCLSGFIVSKGGEIKWLLRNSYFQGLKEVALPWEALSIRTWSKIVHCGPWKG